MVALPRPESFLGQPEEPHIKMPMPPTSSLRTSNPKENTLKEHDISAMLDWAVEWILAKYGKVNVGAPILRRLGAQMDKFAPHKPRRGNVDGSLRFFQKMLLDRINNLLSAKGEVRTRPSNPDLNARDTRR